jgi:hypothetical protein
MIRMRIDRPDCEKAHSFETCVCGDPECGLHVIPMRRNGTPICEVVIGREQLRGVLAYIHENGLDL